MFENDLAELDAAATLAAAEVNEHTLIAAEVRRLQIAAHWADLHAGEAVLDSRRPGTEHPVRLGGEGTPTIAGFAPAELGCVLRMSEGAASKLIGDALDLRHRLRSIWAAAQTGQVPAYQARYLAKATRHLTAEQASIVDHRIAPSLGAVPWGRLERLLDAAILEADPNGADRAAAVAAQERFVRLGRKSEHGLKLIVARAAAGHAIWFKAVIDRIADILGREGDTDPIEVRRSKAIGIIAQPAEALARLCRHQDDDWDGPDESIEEPTEDELDVDQTADNADAEATVERDRTNERGPASPSAPEETYRSLDITPPPFDPKRARPRAVVYVHLAAEALMAGTGICRVEDVGPLMLGQLNTMLGDRCSISLKPVIDLPGGHISVDAYEIPSALREQILLRHPADVFPYAASVTRALDIDHTVRYVSPDKGGPPGQTRLGNLGPHVRRSHNRKTHGGWQVRQPEPGIWLWRSPHRRVYLVNANGTHPLGDSAYAQATWRTLADPSEMSRGDRPAALSLSGDPPIR